MQEGAGAQPEAPVRPPTIEERLDGIASWLAQIDRKLTIRSYAAAAALVIALAAAGVALALVLQVRDDAATTEDVAQLNAEIAGVEDTAAEAAQQDVETVRRQVSGIEEQLLEIQNDQRSADRRISVLQDDIADLREQIDQLESDGGSGGSGGGAGGSP